MISRRQEGIAAPPATLKNALTAIIAAIWIDSGKDLSVVAKVMEKWGLDNRDLFRYFTKDTNFLSVFSNGIFWVMKGDMCSYFVCNDREIYLPGSVPVQAHRPRPFNSIAKCPT